MLLGLRDTLASDLPRIIEIERASYSSPWSLKSFERELTLPFSRTMLATVDKPGAEAIAPYGSVAGFLCRWLVAEECHVLNIAVDPAFRRHGVGYFLLSSTIREAVSKQATFVTLEVRRANFAARQLYRKLHFEERRLRKHYYGPGEDAIVMELELPTVAR